VARLACDKPRLLQVHSHPEPGEGSCDDVPCLLITITLDRTASPTARKSMHGAAVSNWPIFCFSNVLFVAIVFCCYCLLVTCVQRNVCCDGQY